jgi:hypothetical protein
MVNTYDFTKDISNPYVDALCDEISIIIDHSLVTKLLKVSSETNVAVPTLIMRSVYRYFSELEKIESI